MGTAGALALTVRDRQETETPNTSPMEPPHIAFTEPFQAI